MKNLTELKSSGQIRPDFQICLVLTQKQFCFFQSLREVLANQIPEKQEEVKAFRKDHGKTKVGEVTVDMVSTHFYQTGV